MKSIFISMLLISSMIVSGCRNSGPVAVAAPVDTSASEYLLPAVGDVMELVNIMWPSVNTTFVIVKEPEDPFGIAFISGLREYGYAVSENNTDENGVQLSYITETSGNEYDLTLLVDKSLICRSYAPSRDGLTPTSLWTRRE